MIGDDNLENDNNDDLEVDLKVQLEFNSQNPSNAHMQKAF
jgi:hypothetical protein